MLAMGRWCWVWKGVRPSCFVLPRVRAEHLYGSHSCISVPSKAPLQWVIPLGSQGFNGPLRDAWNQHIRCIASPAPSNYRPKLSLQKSRPQLDACQRAEQEPVVYEGQYTAMLRRMKFMSIATCYLSVLTGPILTFFLLPQLSVFVKGGVAGTVILISASTTIGLQWIFGPYVHKLTWKPGDPEIKLEVLSWMGSFVSKTIKVADIRPPKGRHFLVSFAVKNEFYQVDPDRIPHKELLRKLTFYRNQS